jgi:heat shock protein HtpX
MGNAVKTGFLLIVLTAIFVFVGRLVGGQSGMVVAFGLAVAMNFFSYWFSDKLVLRMYGAKEVTDAEEPKLHAMVRRLSSTAGIPMPKVYVIPDESPNAFATGRNPAHAAVAVTAGIRRILTDEELEGVLAHELGHVLHRDILVGTIAATLAGAVMMLANMAKFAAIFGGGRDRDDEGGGGGIALLAVAIVAPLAAMLVQMAVSRSREYMADEEGGRLCGRPRALATALAKISGRTELVHMHGASPATAHMFIVNPLSGGGVMSLFSTHPPVEERIRRLTEMSQGLR